MNIWDIVTQEIDTLSLSTPEWSVHALQKPYIIEPSAQVHLTIRVIAPNLKLLVCLLMVLMNFSGRPPRGLKRDWDKGENELEDEKTPLWNHLEQTFRISCVKRLYSRIVLQASHINCQTNWLCSIDLRDFFFVLPRSDQFNGESTAMM